MPRGGARPNTGPKKGSKHLATLKKEEARELARALITARLQPLIDAQIANAQGLKYLVTRDKKTGKFIRVTEAMASRTKAKEDGLDLLVSQLVVDEKGELPDAVKTLLRDLSRERRELKAAVTGGEHEEIIEVWEKDPSVQAFTDLLNRALDKPAEQVQVTGGDGGPIEIVVKKPW